MTEFETQVAEALQIAVLVEKWGHYPTEAIATDLAPRVAAAIQQAALLPDFGYPRGSTRLEEPELLRRALAALRGETPGREGPA